MRMRRGSQAGMEGEEDTRHRTRIAASEDENGTLGLGNV